MEIKIVEKRIVDIETNGQSFKNEKWPVGANAYIYMGRTPANLYKHATIVYEGLKILRTGWPVKESTHKRRGWNFGEAGLQDEENARLVFGHLIKNECVVYFLHISHIDSRIKTMLQLGVEIVRQLELQI